jgi:iron(III) transport system substrate-binding protein
MKITRRSLVTSVTGLTLLVSIGCSNQAPLGEAGERETGTNAANAGEVNVYSARHYDTDEALYDNFTKETGIQVNVIEGKEDELLERIKSEGTNSPADVFITVDAGRLWRAEEEDTLQPITSPVLEKAIPENLRHPDGLWFGLTERARIIVYNKKEVKPSELSTYEALAEPQWKGRVCVRSSSNVYNQSLLGSMVESKGVEATENWARGLVTNFAREPEGGDIDQIKAVAAGQCDVAIANHYYVARLAKSADPQEQATANQVGVFFPNQNSRGTHINISGVGVVADAPNKENAIKFLEYLVSPEAQKIFAEGNNEYPVVAGVETAPILNSYGDFKSDSVNVSAYGRNSPEAVKIADRVGWK